MFDPNVSVDDLNAFSANTMVQHLGIEFIELGKDHIKAKMPVDHRTVQPLKLLHGGASVALAETLGSVAAHISVDRKTHTCVGLEINANHIRSVVSGYVYGTARPLHLGKKTQVWEIRIENEQGALVCISRITVAVLKGSDATKQNGATE
jgi:1,4-dihydroxy-2-naphthoyl-CoA hydrolase